MEHGAAIGALGVVVLDDGKMCHLISLPSQLAHLVMKGVVRIAKDTLRSVVRLYQAEQHGHSDLERMDTIKRRSQWQVRPGWQIVQCAV